MNSSRMIASRLRILLASWLAAAGLSGCATKAQLVALEDRVQVLEKGHAGALMAAERETKRMQTLATQVEESNNQLSEMLARAGAKLSDVDNKLAKVRGEMEVLSHRLAVIEKTGGAAADLVADVRRRLDQLVADLRDRAGIAVLALPSDLPTDADGFAKMAEAKFAANDARTANAVAAECQKRFSPSEATGRCAMVQARVALQEQRYDNAMRILQGIHDSLANKAVPIVGDALIEIAKILELQGRCGNAQKVFKYIMNDMPKLAAAKVAKDMLASSAARCKEGAAPAAKPEGADPKPADAPKPADPARPAPESKVAPDAKPAEPAKPTAPAKPPADPKKAAPEAGTAPDATPASTSHSGEILAAPQLPVV